MNWNCRGTLLLLKQFEIIGKSEVPLLWLWIITTILFTVMHGGAIEAGILPVVNVVTMCLFTTALYEAEGTLLAPTYHGSCRMEYRGLIVSWRSKPC